MVLDDEGVELAHPKWFKGSTPLNAAGKSFTSAHARRQT